MKILFDTSAAESERPVTAPSSLLPLLDRLVLGLYALLFFG